MTAADCIGGKWRVIRDGKVLARPGCMEEAVFMLSCLGCAPVETVEYRSCNCTIVWTNDFFDFQMTVREAKGKWIVAWYRYEIASFPDRDSAFEWVRKSFDGEKAFVKRPDAEYAVEFWRNA